MIGMTLYGMWRHTIKYLNPEFPELETHLCKDDYSFDYGDFHFQVIDSKEPKGCLGDDKDWPWESPAYTHHIGLDAGQLDWIKKDYQEAFDDGKEHTFFFTHAPIVDTGEESTHVEPNDYYFVLWADDPYNPTERPNVEAVFAGHTHRNEAFHAVLDTENEKVDATKIDNPSSFPYSSDKKTEYFQTQSSTVNVKSIASYI